MKRIKWQYCVAAQHAEATSRGIQLVEKLLHYYMRGQQINESGASERVKLQ